MKCEGFANEEEVKYDDNNDDRIMKMICEDNDNETIMR